MSASVSAIAVIPNPSVGHAVLIGLRFEGLVKTESASCWSLAKFCTRTILPSLIRGRWPHENPLSPLPEVAPQKRTSTFVIGQEPSLRVLPDCRQSVHYGRPFV